MIAAELKNVSFRYEGSKKKILDNVNFSFEYGKVTLLSGLSGEGKSTILYLLTGIIPNVTSGKTVGQVLIDGETIKGKRLSEVCRKAGVVLQNADSQIIQQIVEDEIAFGCENFGFPPEKIKENIDRACSVMKLDSSWGTRTLSGGQKQRLITACTLATGQRILILDEPLANLDKQGTELLMNTLRSLASDGYAVLIVEHRLDSVFQYVDEVWDIRAGKVTKIDDKGKYLASQSEIITDTCKERDLTEPLLKCVHVGFRVKEREILKDIDFTVNKGERLLLLGENGCGKTTLMRMIARLSRPTSGCIAQYLDESFGQNKKGSKRWFKKVGVVYQNPNYQLFMPTVKQEVGYNAESAEVAEEVMRLFKIDSLKDRHPQSLSEGQKRRVSIAAVVAGKPDILLLDEPTVGQDYAGLKDLVNILNDMHDKYHNTIITITHDMRCAQALCDNAVWIENGVVKSRGGKELVREFFFGSIKS